MMRLLQDNTIAVPAVHVPLTGPEISNGTLVALLLVILFILATLVLWLSARASAQQATIELVHAFRGLLRKR